MLLGHISPGVLPGIITARSGFLVSELYFVLDVVAGRCTEPRNRMGGSEISPPKNMPLKAWGLV